MPESTSTRGRKVQSDWAQFSDTPLARIREQPARHSLLEFQTTGRSREDDDEEDYEVPCDPEQTLCRLTYEQSVKLT